METSLSLFIDTIRDAVAAKAPLRIVGGGSKDFYGEPFDAALPVLDTQIHSGIVSYEPSELVITVKAGTPLAEVEAVLAEQGQCFPFEPPHYNAGSTIGGKDDKHATVGGMVAAGLAGPARATSGSVRDFLLGAHLINGKAEHLQFGGTVMKNVAGYDVSRMLAGSMGTLGLITQVSLKVLPVSPAEATLRFEMDEAFAIQSLNNWAGQPLPLNASSWVIDAGVPTLYLRLRGAVAAVQSACQRLAFEAGGVRVDSPEATADWSASRDLQLPWFQAGFKRGDDLWRISVPQSTPPLNLGKDFDSGMIDWLGGQRWLFAPAGDAQAAQRIRAAAHAAQGNATIFIASRAVSVPASGQNLSQIKHFELPSEPLLKIHRELKKEFDPAGIFNLGRLGVI
jgi:glycolate oxidase FAD binding subunit